MFQVVLIPRTEISSCGNTKVVNNNNGILSTRKTGRKNQLKETSTNNLVSMLRKTSTLLPLMEKQDTLTTFLEILFLRLKTEEQARNGTSTEPQEPSNLERRINPLISRTLERVIPSNTTQPTQDGGRSGDTPRLTETAMVVLSRTLSIKESLLLRIKPTRKLNQLLFRENKEEPDINNGRSTILIT